MTATNILLDLASSTPDAGFWEQLRQEAASVFKTADDWNNPASVAKLPMADSTVRESSRKNPVLTRIFLREVVPREGVTLPSGHHMPKGAWLAASTVDVHHDDRFYLKPEEYDPFRFAKKREDVLAVAGADREKLTDRASIYRKSQSLSTASDIFLGFGYAKHSWYEAIPTGRFLVNGEGANGSQSRSLASSSPIQIGHRLHYLEL